MSKKSNTDVIGGLLIASPLCLTKYLPDVFDLIVTEVRFNQKLHKFHHAKLHMSILS
ncbi:hypothetical protein SAMN05192541_14354 [Bradyrhizobium arachidis]|nr:hypothetical protein SAMN05192541_14354 [Bradyrhizobium arachidis]